MFGPVRQSGFETSAYSGVDTGRIVWRGAQGLQHLDTSR